MDINHAFNEFFRGNYPAARDAFRVISHPYCKQYYFLSQLLINPDSSTTKPSNTLLNLESLRQEAALNYSLALFLRFLIDEDSKSLINTLSICDLTLKIKPLNECPISYLYQFNPEENYSQLEARIIAFRLQSILYQISTNHDVSLIGQDYISLCQEYLTRFLKKYPSIQTYYDLAYHYFLIKDFDRARFYYQEAIQKFGNSDQILFGLSNVEFECNNLLEGFDLLTKAIVLNSKKIEYTIAYGFTLYSYGKSDKAITLLENVPLTINDLVKYNITLANEFRKIGNTLLSSKFYYQVIKMIPVYHDIWLNLSYIAIACQDLEKAKTYLQNSISSMPMSNSSIGMSADLLDRRGQLSEAIEILKFAHSNSPTDWRIGESLIEKLRTDKRIAEALEICESFVKLNSSIYRLRSYSRLCRLYLDAGLIVPLLELLDTIQDILIKDSDCLTISWQEWIYLHYTLCFVVPCVRDSVLFNSLIFSSVSERYIKGLSNWRMVLSKLHNIDFFAKSYGFKTGKKIKRIGFLSPHFKGHVVSILSIDVIRELSILSDDMEVLIIPTDIACRDSEFIKFVKQAQSINIVELYYNPSGIVVNLKNLELDILIELDGATSVSNCIALYCAPAIVNISWLGFDAPYISEHNFFLCDRYTHPEGVDELYKEKLIRLPHSHMCVKKFDVADKDRSEVRSSLGITDDQIIFIYTAAVRKFNFDLAFAHAQILLQVPNSVLLVKTSLGVLDTPLEIWRQEVKKLGLSIDRVIPIPYAKTQEEHRFYFKVADVYLDAYPYNGGSQTLEALWCDLPVVTYCGEQSFARMGYSLLSTAGITEGIAHSWEEYIEWAVRLGTDRDLRLSIKERLAKGKDPDHLCPLWNPKQFARDMYNILQELYEQAEV